MVTAESRTNTGLPNQQLTRKLHRGTTCAGIETPEKKTNRNRPNLISMHSSVAFWFTAITKKLHLLSTLPRYTYLFLLFQHGETYAFPRQDTGKQNLKSIFPSKINHLGAFTENQSGKKKLFFSRKKPWLRPCSDGLGRGEEEEEERQET